jgi:hypothetical protein
MPDKVITSTTVAECPCCVTGCFLTVGADPAFDATIWYVDNYPGGWTAESQAVDYLASTATAGCWIAGIRTTDADTAFGVTTLSASIIGQAYSASGTSTADAFFLNVAVRLYFRVVISATTGLAVDTTVGATTALAMEVYEEGNTTPVFSDLTPLSSPGSPYTFNITVPADGYYTVYMQGGAIGLTATYTIDFTLDDEATHCVIRGLWYDPDDGFAMKYVVCE